MSNSIKIGITVSDPESPIKCEWVWARKINADTAKVCNIPMFTRDFSLGALVRFDEQMMFVEVVERGASTLELTYDDSGSKQEVTDRYKRIVAHLKRFDIHCEGFTTGLLAMAVPADMEHEQLSSIIDQLGIKYELEPEPETTEQEWTERLNELADEWEDEC